MIPLDWQFVAHAPENLKKGHVGLALDVGGRSDAPDILYFTHHGGEKAESSTGLLFNNIDQLDAIMAESRPVTIFCHVQPDLDCYASSYLAWGRFSGKWEKKAFYEYGKALTGLVNRLDQGHIKPVKPQEPESFVNFYTLFLFLDTFLKDCLREGPRSGFLKKMEERYGEGLLEGCAFDLKSQGNIRMCAAMCILHGLFLLDRDGIGGFLEETEPGFIGSISPIIECAREKAGDEGDGLKWLWEFLVELADGIPGWISEVLGCMDDSEEIEITLADDPENPVKGAFFNNITEKAAGVVSKIIRGNEVVVTVMAYKESPGRVIISTPPERENSLLGLGLALHRFNLTKGCPQTPDDYRYCRKFSDDSIEPDPLFQHRDPWYDGRGHHYTIVDAPREKAYRMLTAKDVKMLLGAKWYMLAEMYETEEYLHWLEGAQIQCPKS